jgi:hypothetical protein
MTSDGRQTELLKLPYEEDYFLTCVDNQVPHLPKTSLNIVITLLISLPPLTCVNVDCKKLASESIHKT